MNTRLKIGGNTPKTKRRSHGDGDSDPAMQAGGSLVERPLEFTSDSKYVLCCSGTAVKLFACETGALLRVLDAHTDGVTAVAHVASNVFQALSAGLDGRILLWDLDDATVLRAFCVGRPIVAMALHPTAPATAFVLTAADQPAPAWTPAYAQGLAFGGRAYSVSLRVTKRSAKRARDLVARGGRAGREAAADPAGFDSGEEADAGAFGNLELPWPVDARPLFRAKSEALAVASCGEPSPLIAAVSGAWLTVHDTGDGGTGHFCTRRERRAALQCVALSPSERLAATADEYGRVHLWRLDRLTTRDAAARQATGAGAGAAGPAREMHWHAQALQALAFSVDGSLVLSAGREGVLVFWQTHAAERAFLPRLGAPLLGVTPSPDGTTVAVRGADNTVQLIDLGARRVSRVIHGLRRADSLLPDARLRAVVLYGGEAASSLQWWSPAADAHVASLAASPANLSGSLPAIGSQRDSRHRSYRGTAAAGGTSAPRVTRAALSPDGALLATFEVRANAELRQHTCLKLWALRDGAWALVTRVPQPHAGPLTALAFHPNLLLAVTAAHDAKFKLWEAVPPARVSVGTDGRFAPPGGGNAPAPPPLRAGAEVGGWACRSVGLYRQSAAVAAAFSPDGSLLAVAYAPDVMTLWEPLSSMLLATLAQPLEPSDVISYLGFPGDGGTLLAHSSRGVFCLSLLTSHLLWAYQAQEVIGAAADPASPAALIAVALATPAAPRAADGRCTAFAILEFGKSEAGVAADGTVAVTAAASFNGEAGAAGAVAAAVPRRAWRLTERPRSVGFLPCAGGKPGTPLCLSGSGELFLLLDEPTAQAAAQAAAGGARMSLRHVAPSRLASIFGAALSRDVPDAAGLLTGEEMQDAPLLLELQPRALTSSAGGLREAGWEARALDAWLSRHLSSVPSHLLPPVRAIYPHMMGALLLEAPHLAHEDGSSSTGNGDVSSGGEARPSELELMELASARAHGRAASFSRLVELYAPAIRRGKMSAAEHKRKQRAAGSAANGGEAGRGGARGDGASPLPRGLLVQGDDAMREEGEEEGSDDEAMAEAPADRSASLASAGAAGEAGSTALGEPAAEPEQWPPAGWALLEACGLPNPGHLVRDVQTLAAPAWEGSAVPTGLSAADTIFWREHGFGEDALSELSSWVEAEGVGAGGADAERLRLVWEPEDEPPADIWERRSASVELGVALPGAPGGDDLRSEIEQARALLQAAGLSCDEALGYGIAAGPMPADMRQPPTAGWQHGPTKLEFKALAKELRVGEAAAHPIIAAGLRASGVRVARRAAAADDS
jgi:NET1-associated nuclear protein 1 (U3 small nucleolar RNA-associated protein 17)